MKPIIYPSTMYSFLAGGRAHTSKPPHLDAQKGQNTSESVEIPLNSNPSWSLRTLIFAASAVITGVVSLSAIIINQTRVNELNFTNILCGGSNGFLCLKDNSDVHLGITFEEYLVYAQKKDDQTDRKERDETNLRIIKLALNYQLEMSERINGNVFNFNPYPGAPNETKTKRLYPLISSSKIDSNHIVCQMFFKPDIEKIRRWLKLHRFHCLPASVYGIYGILFLFLPYTYRKSKKGSVNLVCDVPSGSAGYIFRGIYATNCYIYAKNGRIYCDFL
jgi:hypothetical protein